MERPQDTVFQTVELLEHILCQLSWTDIYRCHRVCHQFRKVIFNSTVLKQRTWTAPTMYSPHLNQITYNCVNQSQVRSQTLNPLPRNVRQLFVRHGGGRQEEPIPLKHRWSRYWLWLPRPVTSQESWRKMFLTQPPIAEVHFYLRWGVVPPSELDVMWQISGHVRDERGLTLGRLVDLAMMQEAHRSPFNCSRCKKWHRETDCGSVSTAKEDLEEYQTRHGTKGFTAERWTCMLEFELEAGLEVVTR